MVLAVFLMRFGEGIIGGVRTNFFVDTMGLSGGQVLWLEGIREIPGLAAMLIAAVIMHLPLARRSGAAVSIMGVGYLLYAVAHSYLGLIGFALLASLGMHIYQPLHNVLGMSLVPKEHSGRVLGTLASVGALASIIGMGALTLVSRLSAQLSLRAYYVTGGIIIVLAGLLIARLPKTLGATAIEQPRMLIKRRYWLYYVLTFFEGSRKQVLGTFGSLVLVQLYNFEVWQISLILVTSAVINFLCAPIMGSLVDRFGERRMLPMSYLILGLCCLGFATISNVWVLQGLLLTIKLFVTLSLGLPTYVNRIAPAEELAPTLSAGTSINHVTSVAMPLIAGAVLPLVGYQGIFVGTAALIFASVPFAIALRTEKRLIQQPHPVMAE